MIKLVIYRDKVTNEIKNHHEATDKCTEEALKIYNEKEEYNTKAEIIELEENSVAHFFYSMKTREIKGYYEDLQSLQYDIDDISSRIDHKLGDIERLVKEKI